MVVDDDFDLVRLFKRALELHGFNNVLAFTNPLLALEHFRVNSINYKLIVSDIKMPEMNGIELSMRIRAIHYNVQILLMLAFDIKNLAILLQNVSLSTMKLLGFISKPVSIKEFVNRVKELLQSCGDIK